MIRSRAFLISKRGKYELSYCTIAKVIQNRIHNSLNITEVFFSENPFRTCNQNKRLKRKSRDNDETGANAVDNQDTATSKQVSAASYWTTIFVLLIFY